MTNVVDQTQIVACAASYFVMLSGEYLKENLNKKQNSKKEDTGLLVELHTTPKTLVPHHWSIPCFLNSI